jgi:hypothetical protein
MAFVAPTFNLVCNWFDAGNFYGSWAAGTGSIPPPDQVFDCALRAELHGYNVYGIDVPVSVANLLLPAGTDVFPPIVGSSEYWNWADLVEVPAGSGRFYFITAVEDVGKGYMNEYRMARLVPTWVIQGNWYSFLSATHWPYAPPWPRPIP